MSAPSIDVFLGCVLGGALGDSLGWPIEFLDAAEIARRFGAAPPARLPPHGDAPEISDDTQMTLFTIEGLILAHRAPPIRAIADAYLRWYETQGGPPGPAGGWLLSDRRLHARRAPGNTCMSAMSALARTPTALPTVARPPNTSKGCGAVMRSAPIGLAAPSAADAFALARDAGVLTHGHPSGYLSGAYLAALIWDLARGASLPGAMSRADALLAREPGHEEQQGILTRARALAAQGPPSIAALESLGGGWTGEEALAIAIACALPWTASAPLYMEETLWRAANHSGDSDSTASITGNIIGTLAGAARLPAAWLADLELADTIDRLTRELHARLDL